MKITLLTNEHLTNYYSDELVIEGISERLAGQSLVEKTWCLYTALRTVDAYLGFNSDAEIFAAGLLHKVTGGRAKIILWDTNLHRPTGISGFLKALAKRLLLKSVDCFACMHKDTSAYTHYYGINPGKVIYIPFKANNYEILPQFEVSDEGYILSCGASYRDFDCLLAAVRDIRHPVKIVLPKRDLARFHNTHFSIEGVPPHVSVIEHDMNKRTWNGYLAKASIVVIPIKKQAIQPAGISVYLEAMALGKPVIISRGASTEGLIDDTQAVMFEPGNSKQLSSCIVQLLSDPLRRERVAQAGRAYALSLEGEQRLVRALERQVVEMCSDRD